LEEWDSAAALDEDEANELLENLKSMLKPKSLLH
jgi:hypothetical protein